ncbi:MAG: permease prefix domain 1-containing protein [Armatimonadota bacterium]
MSEIDRYLETLRSALEVDAKRADEIIAEVRSHLEARAVELASSGMSRDEATGEAVRGFGEPGRVAGELLRANSRHRQTRPVAVVSGLAAAFIGVLSAFSLLEDAYQPLDLGGQALWVLAMIALSVPSALLAGLCAGRRWCWVAAAPVVGWGLVLWAMIAAAVLSVGASTYRGWRDEAVLAGVLTLVGGPVLAGSGLLGSTFRSQRAARVAVSVAGAAYLAVSGVLALLLQVHDLVGVLATVAIAGLVLAAVASASLWQQRSWLRIVARVLALLCILCAGRMVASVVEDPDRKLAFWWTALSTEAAICAVVVAVVLWARRSERLARRVAGDT